MKNKEKKSLVGYINPFLLKSIYQIESFQDGDRIDCEFHSLSYDLFTFICSLAALIVDCPHLKNN